jgi:CzcA family heavy metal efflux pump
MIRWVVGSSLKFRRLVIAIGAGMMFFGIMQLGNTPIDVLPEFAPPTVEVQAEALGLSAEEVEQLITVPLEQDLLNGVAFLDEIHSASLPGLSSVVMTFEPGTDLLDARQVVAERLAQAVGAAGLPEVSKPPQMLQPLSSTSRVSMIKLSSDTVSPIEMSVLARWVISPRLLGVDGVANVAIWGQRERQLQVLADPERLRDQEVSLEQVIRTTGNALEVSPLSFLEASSPGTGGFIDTANQRLQIFHEQTISTPDELAQVPLEDTGRNAGFSQGKPLTLGDVTDVVEDHQPLIGDANCGGAQCLLLVIEKFPGANTLEVTEGLDSALDALRPGLLGVRIDTGIYRPANFIEASFANLGRALLIGALLLLIVIGAFLWDWRTALITAVAIPLSLVAAGLVLYFRDVTVNAMILAGLVMALVALIDDAMSDVEEVSRRLHEHRTDDEDHAPLWRTIMEASLEIRSAFLFATLIIFAALLPIFFMDGRAGAFLSPLAGSYMLAVAASMAVALTVTPALRMMLLAGAPLERRRSPVVGWLQRGYASVSSRIVPRLGPALVAVIGIMVAGLVALPFLDTSLRPSLKERDVLIELEAAPGTSLTKMNELTTQIVRELGTLSGISNVGAHVGRATMSDQVVNVNSGEIWVKLDPSTDYGATIATIEDVVDDYRELSSEVLTYSERRVTEVLEQDDNEIVVRVYGENSDVTRSKAEELEGLISEVDGIDDPRVEFATEEPTLEVEVDLARAHALGLSPGDVRRSAATLLSGITVGNLFEEQKVFDVVVWGAPEIRESLRDVRELLIDTPSGGHVRLGEVASPMIVPSPTVIRHESVASYVDVSANVVRRDVAAVADDVESTLQQVDFPLEHHAELLGGFAERQAARYRVLAVALAAAIAIFLWLQAAFNSWRVATFAFLTLPLALVGGVLAVLVVGGTITLGSIAGFVAVLGIAVRSEVLLIRHYQHLERHEGERFGTDLVVRGTREQLAPILMTALATATIFAPFVIVGDVAGLEIVRPMAVVILGGLLTSTLLNLVIVPATYLRYGFVSRPDMSEEELVFRFPEVDRAGGRRA